MKKKMSKNLGLFSILVLSLALTGWLIECGGGSSSDRASYVGGQCEYNDIKGVASIISVSQPDAGDYSCSNNPVKVVFDFHPDASNASKQYLYPQWSDYNQTFTISEGKNPPGQCVNEEGLIVGSKHNCIRKEITKGSCTPVIFYFPDVDESRCIKECY
jgi:hypothetical protein